MDSALTGFISGKMSSFLASNMDRHSHLHCRESFWPEQQCWVETPEPPAGMTSECDAHVLEMCVLLVYTSVSSHRILLHLMHMACGAQ